MLVVAAPSSAAPARTRSRSEVAVGRDTMGTLCSLATWRPLAQLLLHLSQGKHKQSGNQIQGNFTLWLNSNQQVCQTFNQEKAILHRYSTILVKVVEFYHAEIKHCLGIIKILTWRFLKNPYYRKGKLHHSVHSLIYFIQFSELSPLNSCPFSGNPLPK